MSSCISPPPFFYLPLLFMTPDVSAYYEQTQNHYQRWWKLDQGMSLHYGLWYNDTKNFLEALENTNRYMAGQAKISKNAVVLDAGCGVGGAAIFLASNYSARVKGVSLSERQITTARANAVKHAVADQVSFVKADYTKTDFADGSFDYVWACESSSSAADKSQMLAEWYRLLKPEGKLILLDFFKASPTPGDVDPLLNKWSELWAMSPLISTEEFSATLERQNFKLLEKTDLTNNITPTIKWLYRSYLYGRLPAVLYNLFFGAQKYSRNHYKSGLYQYQAYQQGLWRYCSFLAKKSDAEH